MKEITNLIPLLESIKEAEIEKARKIDDPIKEKVYKHVRGYCSNGGRTRSGDWLPTYTLHATMELKNVTDKEVKNVQFCGMLYDGDGNYVRSIPFDVIKSIAPQAGCTAKTEIKLNEFETVDNKCRHK